MNNKERERKRTDLTVVKKTTFAFLVIVLTIMGGMVIKSGKFEHLEGYMYSIAADITKEVATCSDATSSNATSSNATSSNATSCNATSSNATSSNANKVNNNKETPKKQDTNKAEVNATATTLPTVRVEKEEKVKNEYNNSEITAGLLENLVKNEGVQEIILNLDKKTIINKEIFNTIKGKNKKIIVNSNGNQMIFDGNTIENPKDIDANITCVIIDDKSELKDSMNSGVIINFANNGNLPGEATIRIKVTDDIKDTIDLETVYVYFYNEETKELIEILSDANYSQEEYIEFTIDHNSKYVIASEKIEKNETATESISNDDETVTFLESHKMYVLIIGASVLVIIIVTVILIVDKKTKGKANKVK